jgi:WD40 repeat protein
LLDADTGDESWQATELARSIWVSPNGQLIATVPRVPHNGAVIFTAKLLNRNSGTVLRDLGQVPHQRAPAAFSPDSHQVIVPGTFGATIVDVASGAIRRVRGGTIVHLAWVETGPEVVAIRRDCSVIGIDTATGDIRHQTALANELLMPLGVFDQGFAMASFSPDRTRVAARPARQSGPPSDLHLGVYDCADGRPAFDAVPMGMKLGDLRVLFSPDGRLVAANAGIAEGNRPGVTVLNAVSGKVLFTIDGEQINDIAFSSDGCRLVAAGAGFVRVHDLGTVRSVAALGFPASQVSVTATGIRLTAAIGSEPHAALFDADTGNLLLQKSHPGALTWIGFTPGGRAFVTGSTDGGVRLFDTVSGERRWLANHGGPITAVAVSPATGSVLATASRDKTARLVTTETGAERWQHRHPQSVTEVAISADERLVATGCADRVTRILDAATGAELHRQLHDGRVRALCFAPTGTLVATGNEDGTVLVIDAATGKTSATVPHTHPVTSVTFSPDGRLLASGDQDGVVRISEVEPPVTLLRQLNTSTPIALLTFHPVDQLLCVLGESPIVGLYEPHSGREHHRLIHPGPVRHLAFSADGSLLATACDDGKVRVYTMQSSP